MDKERIIETATLFVFVLLLDFRERRRPGHEVDRKWELYLNLIALAVVILAGEVCKELILRVVRPLMTAPFLHLTVISTIPGTLKIFIGVALADLSLYWVHRGMHWRPILWRTHVFHHSIKYLWWLSGSRTSVLHLLLFALPQVIIAYILLQMTALEAGIAFSIGVVVNLWIHSNISVNLGGLEWLLITPDYHRVHHGTKALIRTNLGFVFTIWDRLFGTYTDPNTVEKDFVLGAVPTRKRLLRMIMGF